MSISPAQKTRLGIFLVIGLFFLVLLMGIPLSRKMSDHQKTYYAYFIGESVSGLELGSIVKYHGVPVGKVKAISYDAKDLNRIKATISMDQEFPVKSDMYAQAGPIGITGLMYIEILGGSNDSPLLKQGSTIETKPSIMSSLTGHIEPIMGKVELLLEHLNRVSNPDSLRAIKTILDNVAIITEDAKTFTQTAAPDLRAISISVLSFVGKLDSISTEIHQLSMTLNQGLAGNRMGTIMANVDSAAIAMRTLSETASLTVKQSREDFMISMQNLREALENANELTKILTENPSLLIRGEQQRARE